MRFYLILPLILAFSALRAQSPLQDQVDALVADPSLRGADISISVIDLESNKLVAGHHSNTPLVPASSLKVLTTATALAILGPAHTFPTDLEYDGAIDEAGVLHGNIYIKGYGDPTLGSDKMPDVLSMEKVFESWVQAIKKAGIKSIDGSILADDSWFDNTPVCPNWSWSDIGNYYGAGAWSLNMHENLYYLSFQQNWNLGTRPKIRGTSPAIKGLSFENDVVTASSRSGDNAYIYGRVYTYFREVSGTIPAGGGIFVIKGSMPDPPVFTAQTLNEKLGEAGISCTKDPGKISPPFGESPKRNLILRMQSPTLKRIVERANLESVNVYCEVLLRVIGKHWLGTGSREAGIMAIRQVWEDRGISWENAILDDGCGLSAENKISSWQLAATIRKAWLDDKLRPSLEASLPLAGRSGTMRHYLNGTVAEGKLRAKTGSMRGVRSYTGIARNSTGKEFAFSIIVNKYRCSSSQVKRELAPLMQQLCR
ncbi:MAG: D-alanyl-D-alanine carboxypeptidase/D-alanyl-D-alanine-endopeptidase [Bacteroidetes bacterium]|nr:D-alanyl-D-alanine carboxypeptidase/D-alanyl-D-alanine-endopeptidase [Bacteroidota bacterium]